MPQLETEAVVHVVWKHRFTGEPRSSETPPPWDPTVAPCLGTYTDPRGMGVSYERGTPEEPTGNSVAETLGSDTSMRI